MIMVIAIFCLFYIQVECTNEVCYPSIGCFTQEEPWTSFLRPLPKPDEPEKIGVGFYIFTKKTEKETDLEKRKIQINAEYAPDKNSLKELDYDSSREMTVFIIHGFMGGIKESLWIPEMASAYNSRINANVIGVDWAKGADLENYFQAAANSRVVAAIFINFLRALIKDSNQDVKKIHCVGHSLGAHIIGYAGKNIPGMKRGTGLDPARPCFEGTPPEVRLDVQDFEFVDVMHTNGEFFGFGYSKSIGTVDFYVNGGENQPGCTSESFSRERLAKLKDLATEPIKALFSYSSCSHTRACEYFIEAIQRTDCVMWGRPMTAGDRKIAGFHEGILYNLFKEDGTPCDVNTCTPMGLDTVIFKAKGDFYVKTRSEKPYCVEEKNA